MSKKIKTPEVKELFEAILALKNEEECFLFFEDVCTTNEILSFAQRYQVAKLLGENRTYQEIAEKSGASTATISRVKRSIDDGSGGYEMIFKRLKK
ncbi:MAG: TrpR YerC/YecD [Lachnospiraceae bacterium]|nr:TrpR YerC/YecD [Lachnospiraceae bacterium]MDO4529655.1 YerC/YecD family TrpR-related protein [Lachnospiraceae bacterium]MDO4734440.1 YerC/YecD family TrpR-related protein [Lachnospiraceae bacterium]